MLKIRNTATIVAFGAAITLTAHAVAAGSPGAVDPLQVALPALDNDDPAKSVHARVAFDSATSAHVVDTGVSTQRAHTHAGDPPLIELTLRDADGVVLDKLNAWNPRWIFTNDDDGESMTVVPSATGSFVVPFSPTLASMDIRDQELDRHVLTVDLQPAIREFCTANPADPDCKESDLAVTAIDVSDPGLALLGQTRSITAGTTVVNNGPDGPAAATVVRSVSASGGLTVAPTAPATSEESLEVNQPKTLSSTYEVTCAAPGNQWVEFTSEVSLASPTTIDASTANNTLTKRVGVDCVVPIQINVRPGGSPNSINLNTDATLAALTTSEGEYGLPMAFDASRIDPATVRWYAGRVPAGGGAREIHRAVHLQDSYEMDETTRDGDRDAVLHFKPKDAGLTGQSTEGCLTGSFQAPDGQQLRFFGCDSVRVITRS